MIADFFSCLIMLIGAFLTGKYIAKALFGKCPHCGSRKIVPDQGLSFYCNGCHDKFY